MQGILTMKRAHTPLIWICCLGALLSGCKRQEQRETELVIWSNPSGVEEQAFLRMCRRFEQEHPSIRVRNVGRSDETKLIRAIVAAAPPDLAYIYGTELVGPL